MLDIEDLNTFLYNVKELAEPKNREWILEQKLKKFEDKIRVLSILKEINQAIDAAVCDFLVVTRKVLMTDLEPELKEGFKKLIEKSTEMVTKDSLNRHYRCQIEGLNNQIEVLVEEKRKLLEENLEMQKQIKDYYSKKDSSLPQTPSPAKIEKAVPMTEVPRGAADRARRCTINFLNTIQKGTMQTGLLDSLNPLLQILSFVNKASDFSHVRETVEENYKKIIYCEELLILRKAPTGEFKGNILGQEITIPNLSKYPSLVNPYLVNTVLIDDEFMRIIQNTFLLSVYNYLTIPRKSQGRGNQTIELMVFMNKTNKRGTRTNFAKVDEVLAQVISQFNFILEKHEKLHEMHEREKELKTFTYLGAEELLSCVNLLNNKK